MSPAAKPKQPKTKPGARKRGRPRKADPRELRFQVRHTSADRAAWEAAAAALGVDVSDFLRIAAAEKIGGARVAVKPVVATETTISYARPPEPPPPPADERPRSYSATIPLGQSA